MSAATSEALHELGEAIAYGIARAILGGCELPLEMIVRGANGVRARYQITLKGECLLLDLNIGDEDRLSMPFDFTFVGANETIIVSKLERVKRPSPN